MSVSHSAVGILLVLGGTAVVVAALDVLQRRVHVDAEGGSQMLHVAGGLLSLGLPFLFDCAWAVVVLSGFIAAGFQLFRDIPALRVFRIQGRCRRDLFSLWVAAVFVLSGNERLPYTICLLVLTFADAGAAVAGRLWGATRLSTGKHGRLGDLFRSGICGNVGRRCSVAHRAVGCVRRGIPVAAGYGRRGLFALRAGQLPHSGFQLRAAVKVCCRDPGSDARCGADAG